MAIRRRLEVVGGEQHQNVRERKSALHDELPGGRATIVGAANGMAGSEGHEKRAADAAQLAVEEARRSANAGERAAAAQEAIADATKTSAAADLEAPWSYERTGNIVWLLHNRLGRRAYGVELSGHPYIKRGADADKIDGYSAHQFMIVNGEGDPLTVTWHWLENLSDDVPPWTGILPR